MYGLSDRAEEVLEWLWIEIEEKKNKPDINNIKDREALAELTDDGYIDVNKGGLLTQKGMEEATGCIRRHRLAERLLKDIFYLTLKKTFSMRRAASLNTASTTAWRIASVRSSAIPGPARTEKLSLPGIAVRAWVKPLKGWLYL
jgi:Mn-dependent DtxR family transcriptional regulator